MSKARDLILMVEEDKHIQDWAVKVRKHVSKLSKGERAHMGHAIDTAMFKLRVPKQIQDKVIAHLKNGGGK